MIKRLMEMMRPSSVKWYFIRLAVFAGGAKLAHVIQGLDFFWFVLIMASLLVFVWELGATEHSELHPRKRRRR